MLQNKSHQKYMQLFHLVGIISNFIFIAMIIIWINPSCSSGDNHSNYLCIGTVQIKVHGFSYITYKPDKETEFIFVSIGQPVSIISIEKKNYS